MDEMTIIDRLNQSLDELEAAIQSAIKNPSISRRPEIVFRMNEYEKALEKQRVLARHAFVCIKNRDVNQLTYIVNTINALSAFIKDDAKEILAEISGTGQKPEIIH